MDKYLENKSLITFVNNLANINIPMYFIGHINTDYDSIGSCCCLAYALNKIGKQTYVVVGNDAKILLKDQNNTYFDGFLTENIVNDTNSYCAVLMDMNSTYRAGGYEKDYLKATIKVNIDHHDNNNMTADYKFVDSKSGANCENVLKIILLLEKKFGIKILSKDICSMLCLGIITDTCDIVNSSNITQTRWAIQKIEEFKINVQEIAQNVFYSLNKNQEKILSKALLNKQTYNFLSYYYVNCKDFEQLNLIHNDYAKILSNICSNDNNKVIVFEQRFEDHSVWEFRSCDIQKYPVNEIALKLGGGGHKNASGATITNLNSKEVINEFLNYFK